MSQSVVTLAPEAASDFLEFSRFCSIVLPQTMTSCFTVTHDTSRLPGYLTFIAATFSCSILLGLNSRYICTSILSGRVLVTIHYSLVH